MMEENITSKPSIFVLPVLDQFILYAPLHNITALLNRSAAYCLRDLVLGGAVESSGPLAELAGDLLTNSESPPLPKHGDLSPVFLGIIPTRNCNLACRYCAFITTDESPMVMDLQLARDVIEWYMQLVRQNGMKRAEIHYFGGEPFCGEHVLDLTIPLATLRAREIGCQVRFETATNGIFGEERCRWAAENFDSIVLSFDGPPEIQDEQRPYRDGRGSYAKTAQTAKILSEGAADVFFRCCVSAHTVERMTEIATWFAEHFHPRGVCFEPMQPRSSSDTAANLTPPDPWQFARHFLRTAGVLDEYGIQTIYAAADIRLQRINFCPMGQDVVIVSPDGTISACYLLQRDWEAEGLDLRLGRFEKGNLFLDRAAIAFCRNLNVWNKRFCEKCFCKWHCAGGCHVHHRPTGVAGAYDRFCIQTRAITLCNILRSIGRADLVATWLASQAAMEGAVLQTSDRLIDLGSL